MQKLDINISSSFVKKNLKLVNDKGAGEAKLFVGSMQKENELDSFFNNFSTSNKYYFEKTNLLDYLKFMKIEYLAQKCNEYKDIDADYYDKKLKEVLSEGERIDFLIEPFKDSHRIYIRGYGNTKEIFEKYTRELALPKISKILVEKEGDQFKFLLTLDFDEILKREVLQTTNDKVQNAVEFLQKLIQLNDKHFEIDELKTSLDTAAKSFKDKFSLDNLQQLNDDELERKIFGGKDNDSLLYNLVSNPEYRIFGGIGTVNPYTHKNIDSKDLLQHLSDIDEFIKNISSEKLESFISLIEFINSKSEVYMERLWFKKLLHIYYPDFFPAQIKYEEQKKVLLDLAIIPDSLEQSYFYLSTIARYLNIPTEYFYYINTLSNEFEEVDNETQIDESIRISSGENVLFYGVPGSGKSHTLETEFGKENMVRVVFHPDYMNTDFIGQILPSIKEDDTISYEFKPGPFTKVMEQAYKNPSNMYYLVIEEINRGNAPAIFGEIFQLLDRTEDGESKYAVVNYDVAKVIYGTEDRPIRIPSNLTLLATMNTSDQNVFTLDTAFQRRWNMRMIVNDINSAEHRDESIADSTVTWGKFNTIINELILSSNTNMLSSEDKRLGAYFISPTDLRRKDEVERSFSEKVIKYLWDDAFKFSRDKLFDTSTLKSLEDVILMFITQTGDARFNIFKEDIKKSLVFKPSVVTNEDSKEIEASVTQTEGVENE